MRRVAFYFYTVPDPRRPGKTKRTHCRYNSEQPPRHGVPIENTLEWRDLPDSPDEYEHTNACLDKPGPQG